MIEKRGDGFGVHLEKSISENKNEIRHRLQELNPKCEKSFFFTKSAETMSYYCNLVRKVVKCIFATVVNKVLKCKFEYLTSRSNYMRSK